jgi:hypothetical protein
MKHQIKKTIFAAVILAILVLSSTIYGSATPVSAKAALQTAAIVYDNFDDNLTDPALWSIELKDNGPTASETNQRLEITLPAESAGDDFAAWYDSACQLRGDYDIQVDYEVLTWPLASGVRLGLTDNHANMHRVSSGRQPNDYPGGPDLYMTIYDTPDHVVGITPTSDLSGKLRLGREGDTISTYYFSNGEWTLDASNSGSSYSDDTPFALGAWSADSVFTGQEVKIAFDNLIINKGELVCPSDNVATGQIIPPSATCAQFAAGTAANLDEATYQLLPIQVPTNKKNRVYSISPMDFYYYSKVIAPAASFQITVSQFNTGGWPNLYNSLFDSRVYNAGCAGVGSFRPGSATAASIPFKVNDATPGAVYYIGIHYLANSVLNRPVTSPYPTVPYTFTTAINNTLIDTGTDTITFRYQP